MSKTDLRDAGAALLLLLALALPAAQRVTAEDGAVRAAHLSGTPATPIFDPADCTASADGTARYFASVRSSTGMDITDATGRLVFTGNATLLPAGVSAVVNMFNGDLESQANDGNQPSCVPAVNDGHRNDLASTFVPSFPGVFPWSMVIAASGFTPVTVDLAAATDGVGACPLGDADRSRAGCLISIGSINLQPLAAPAGRGVLAGSTFASDGQPLDGVTAVLSDFSGNVHTRMSGSDCNGVRVTGTGFYCFSDSDPTDATFNDGLGLPVGSASLVAASNVAGANCPTGAAGTPCGFLPAATTVNVGPGAVSGQDIFLFPKLAPAAAPSSQAGAFGFVVNSRGQGVGGLTITATAAGQPTGAATTSVQTGSWSMSGLAAGVAYSFTVSGPGLEPGNVRPSLAITQTTGSAGTWLDPNWVIVAPRFPIPTPFPPPVPTQPPPVAGGRGFTLQSLGGGQVLLTWQGGAAQTGYNVFRFGAGPPVLVGTLQASAVSFADTVPLADRFACYALQVVSGPTAIAVSDVLCVIPRLAAGLAPGNLSVGLNQGPTASLGWSAPPGGGQTGYLVVPLGTLRAQVLPATATAATDNTGGLTTCYAVATLAGSAVSGVSDAVCAIPGLSRGL